MSPAAGSVELDQLAALSQWYGPVLSVVGTPRVVRAYVADETLVGNVDASIMA